MHILSMRFSAATLLIVIVGVSACSHGSRFATDAGCAQSMINVGIEIRVPHVRRDVVSLANDALAELGYVGQGDTYRSEQYDCFITVEHEDNNRVAFTRFFRNDDPDHSNDLLRAALVSLIDARGLTPHVRLVELLLLQD